jgi:hypothetical protein
MEFLIAKKFNSIPSDGNVSPKTCDFFQPDSISNDVPTEGNETTDDSDVMIASDIELIVLENSETQSLPANNNTELPIGNNQHVSNGIDHVQVVSSGLRFVPMQQLLQNPEMVIMFLLNLKVVVCFVL